ncbi:Protein kinase-like domain protein [Niveomyces insectorum RCEF 264]|uniref:Protein kinase-like domain protein n=1 Tax=Niveomyces insectorum RCEF 264 TaxID=1081102 RepID=A0A162KC24_9HYPO|nr:Protein kinase-like domain protein [Niveomyces insectorum RCEF 264]
MTQIERLVSAGSTELVELVPGGTRVEKAVIPWMQGHMRHDQINEMRREIAVYNHLPKGHPRLLSLLSSYDTGDDVGIELEYMPNGSLREYVAKCAAAAVDGVPAVPKRLRARWALEVVDGIKFLHAHNVIHGDIKPDNIVVDRTLGTRIIDLSGCALLDQPALCLENTRYFMPRPPRPELDGRRSCSVVTDLFGAGSTLYFIVTGRQPYEELADAEVEARYELHEFPSLDDRIGEAAGDEGENAAVAADPGPVSVLFAGTIRKCWHGQFTSATDVLAALQAETRATFCNDDLAYIEATSGIALRKGS